jgi:multidrug efflux pump subunit AcrA (membrane-fusion protein)
MMRKFVIPGLVILGSVFGGVTLMATSPELEPDVPEPVPTTVRVQVVEPRAIKLSVHSQGTVSPNTESQLIPEVSGRVQYMSPSLVNGGHFQAGDVLLRLEDQDYRSANQRAAAALARAEAEYEHARFEYQRIESLEALGFGSRLVFQERSEIHP